LFSPMAGALDDVRNLSVVRRPQLAGIAIVPRCRCCPRPQVFQIAGRQRKAEREKHERPMPVQHMIIRDP
jgi:hypothetical protein